MLDFKISSLAQYIRGGVKSHFGTDLVLVSNVLGIVPVRGGFCMFFRKAVTLTVCMCVLGFHSAAFSQVMSFKEWKDNHIQTSSKKVRVIKSQLGHKKTVRQISGQDPNLAMKSKMEAASTADNSVEKLEEELNNEIYNLEMAHDLSVTDYFVGYLTKVPNRKAAFNEVAAKLTPSEVSELMGAYANSIIGKSLTKDSAVQTSSNIGE